MPTIIHGIKSGKILALGSSHPALIHPGYREQWDTEYAAADPSADVETTTGPRKLPLQWLDIYGEVNEPLLEKIKSGVFDTIAQRPGVTEASSLERD